MFNQLTNKQKFQYTLIAFGFLLMLSYWLAIKKTIAAHHEYVQNEQLEQTAKASGIDAGKMQTKVLKFQSLEKAYLLDSTTLDRNILTQINMELTDLNLSLKEYKPLATDKQRIWTRSITVEGAFTPILTFIYHLEQKDKLCRVASVDFQKNKNNTAKGSVLDCTLYIQNILPK